MTREEVINNARVLVMPHSDYPENRGLENHNYDLSPLIDNHKHIILPNPSSLDYDYHYLHNITNEHHFTTQYHYNNTLPALKQLLHFPFKKKDFYLIENKISINGYGDFSFYLPKKQYYYNIFSFIPHYSENNTKVELVMKNFSMTHTELTSVNNPYEICTTPYHSLFKFAHQSCIITNRNIWNNIQNVPNPKRLIISSDSHIIPLIPILSPYYLEIIVFDNRLDVSLWDQFRMNERNINDYDVLFLIWDNNKLEKYTIENLR